MTGPTGGTWFAFATDLLDEGVDTALDRLLGPPGAGFGGVTVAAVYHAARDVFPHNPAGRVRYLEGGACYFRPDAGRYVGGAVRPLPAAVTQDADPFALLRDATAERSAGLHAWTVYLHTDRPGDTDPSLVQRNVYGDPYLTDLCPANPDVRAYAVALTGDLARYGCDTVLAESLHFHPLGHGYHHERYLFDLPPLAEFLLGLCFCEHCRSAGHRAGVDVDGLVTVATGLLDRAMAGDAVGEPGELTVESVAMVAGGELAGYLSCRQQTVTGLVAEVAAALAGSGTGLEFLDQAGAAKGYATGLPEGVPAADAAWQFGVDVAAVGRLVAGYRMLGYAQDPARVRADAAAYRRRLGGGVPLRCVLRPGRPDCASPANLTAKLDVLDAPGSADVAGVDFYHYGLLPMRTVDMVGRVLTGRGPAERNLSGK